ncbi:MAG: cation:proton antiporter [Treponemataceae bacterium]
MRTKLSLTAAFAVSGGVVFAQAAAPLAETMSELALQLGIIVFAVRVSGVLFKKMGIPTVLGELLIGILIGPFALGNLSFPGFPQGIFPIVSETISVSPQLYGIATIAAVILLFTSGLETDLTLFLRFSIAGIGVGIGGVVCSFLLGASVGIYLLGASFSDPRCLFLGILSSVTSVGISARILSDQKQMDSPEGVTILAAAVFDDLLGIVMLAVVLGIVALAPGAGGWQPLDMVNIGVVTVKVFGISLAVSALGILFSKKTAAFLKRFSQSYDFSVLAIAIALILAGVFEKLGIAMIVGAYVAGLSLSKTDLSTVIQERIRGIYEFFVPVFFVVMGMMVDVRLILEPHVLILGGVYTVAAIISKIVGCGGPALLLGFNMKGAIRIGAGMVPRGEVALIIAGIGLTAKILDDRLFGSVILMTLATTFLAPAILNATLKIPGIGTRKPAKGEKSVAVSWEFPSDDIADLIVDTLLKDLRNEGFYVQMMNIDDGLSQARKGDVALSITKEEQRVTIETSPEDLWFVKTAVFEVLVKLEKSIEGLKTSANPATLRKEFLSADNRRNSDLFGILDPACVSLNLRGTNKEEIISELAGILHVAGKISDRVLVTDDVLLRERTMSTGMQHGVALPHAKTDGAIELCVAIGIKKDGVDFEAIDEEPSRLFILIASPKKTSGPHIQFLAAIGAVLKKAEIRERLIKARTKEEVVALIRTNKT